MSGETEFLRGKIEEADGAMVRRPRARFNRRGNDVWADRSGRVYAPGMDDEPRGAGLMDYSSPVTGNGMGNLSRLVGGKRRGGASHKAKTSQVSTTHHDETEAEKAAKAKAKKETEDYYAGVASRTGTSMAEQQRLTKKEADKQVFSRVADAFVKTLPPGLSTAGALALTLNPYSEYYIPPEQRTAARYAQEGITTYALARATGAVTGKLGAMAREAAGFGEAAGAEAAAVGRQAAVPRPAATPAAVVPGSSAAVPRPSTAAVPAASWAGRPAPPAIERENWLAWSRANPPPPPSTPYPGVVGRGARLTTPLLRGKMDPTGVGKVYNVMSSPDYETLALMSRGEDMYEGGGRAITFQYSDAVMAMPKGIARTRAMARERAAGRRPGAMAHVGRFKSEEVVGKMSKAEKAAAKLTPHEKQALELEHEAKAMGMTLEEHLKHNKIPAAKRRTVLKRAANAVAKGNPGRVASHSGKRSNAPAPYSRGKEIARLMREEGMTLGEASKHLAAQLRAI